MAARQSLTHTPYRNQFRSYRSHSGGSERDLPASDSLVFHVTDYIGYVCLVLGFITDRFPFLHVL